MGRICRAAVLVGIQHIDLVKCADALPSDIFTHAEWRIVEVEDLGARECGVLSLGLFGISHDDVGFGARSANEDCQ